MSALLELAARCEDATGPDRQLDAQIAAACRIGTEQWAWANGYPSWEGRADGRVYLEAGGPSFAAPSFTASLDAAMTLVPEGCDRWVVIFVNDLVTGPEYISGVGGDQHHRTAASGALALCAAALRARASQEVAETGEKA